MSMNRPSDAAARRRMTPLIRAYVQHIVAPPSEVFPLICPVREAEWAEGWAESCDLVWSASGLCEPGCVFRTSEAGWPETVWIVTDHDPDRGLVRFARVTLGLAASTLDVTVEPAESGTSSVSIRYTVVPTSLEGVRYAADRYDAADMLESIVWWERSMNHFLRTGRMLRRSASEPTSKE